MGCTSPYRTAEQLKKLKEIKKLSETDNWARKNKLYPEIRDFLKNKKVKKKNIKRNYEKAYNILMDYWDYIPEEERTEVDKRLRKCNL
jgi:hypothetical protein